MPQLPEITAKADELHPTEQGIEAFTQAAYRSGRFYNEAGEALRQAAQAKAAGAEGIVRGTEALGKSVGQVAGSVTEAADQAEVFAAHQEISKGIADGSQGILGLTQAWNKTTKNADPNSGLALQNSFMGQDGDFQKWATNYVDGFNTPDGKAWARDYVAHARAHLFEKTSADVMTMGALAVEKNVNDAGRAWSNTAFGDPSSVDWLLSSAEKSIDGIVATSPAISGVDAVRVKTEQLDKVQKAIVQAGAYGVIANARDPVAAVAEYTKRYPNLIDGAEAKQFAKTAQVQTRMLASYNKANLIYSKQIADQNVATARNDIWDKNVTTNPDGTVSVKPQFFRDAAKLPGQYRNAPSAIETAKTMIDWGERQSKPGKTVSDPAIMSGLDDRMFAQEDPTTAIDVLKAEAAGKLTRQDGEIRLQLIKAREAQGNPDPTLTDALRKARDFIEPIQLQSGLRLGQDKVAAFNLAFMTEYQKQKAAGTLPANALDLSDPKSLISQTLMSYRPPLAQAVLANGGVGPRINTAPVPAAVFKPPSDWMVNRARGQYRDPAGNLYDLNGKPVKAEASGPAT